jgi:hypothetical protein
MKLLIEHQDTLLHRIFDIPASKEKKISFSSEYAGKSKIFLLNSLVLSFIFHFSLDDFNNIHMLYFRLYPAMNIDIK